MKTLLFALALVGCAQDVTPAPAVSSENSALRSLLRARHTVDLPDEVALAHFPGALASLREMAWSDDHLMVRRRAAGALGVLAPRQPEAEQALVDLLADGVDPGVRAAAVTGLAGCNLAGRAELRARIEAEVFSPDPVVAYAAVSALADVPASRPLLARVAASPAVDARTRARATSQLGGPALPRPPVVIRKMVR